MPTKTFGLSSPTDILWKLQADVERLREATTTRKLQFAALDCAVWSWHMIDWVLNSVTDDHCKALTGVDRKKAGDVASRKFAELNAHRLPGLLRCEQIANTGKHLTLTRSPDDPSFVTHHTVKLDPPFNVNGPFPQNIKARPVALITQENGMSQDAGLYFEDLAKFWSDFLEEEGLFVPEPEFSEADW